MNSFFSYIYDVLSKKTLLRRVALWLSFALVAFGALNIRFEQDIYKAFPNDVKLKKYSDFFNSENRRDKITILLLNPEGDETRLVEAANAFAEGLQKRCPQLLAADDGSLQEEDIIDIADSITQNLPFFLDQNDYRKIDSLADFEVLKKTLEKQKSILSDAGFGGESMLASEDPTGILRLGLAKLSALRPDTTHYFSDGKMLSNDNKSLIYWITPSFSAGNTGKGNLLSDAFNAVRDSLIKVFPDVQIDYFGTHFIAAANASVMQRDIKLTASLATILLLLGSLIYFKRKRAPALILLPVLFGGLLALSLIGLIKGEMSLIALGVGAVIIGIAINAPIHLLNHYRDTGDIRETIRDLSVPLTVGSLTTVGGFLCLTLLDSSILNDIGYFGAFTLLGTSLFTLLFLPHFVYKQKTISSKVQEEDSESPRGSSLYRKWIPLAIVVLTPLFFSQIHKLKFDDQLDHLNFMSGEMKITENRLDSLIDYKQKYVFLISEGKTPDQALEISALNKKTLDSLKNAGIVGSVQTPSALLLSPEQIRVKLDNWNQFWTPEKRNKIKSNIRKASENQGFSPEAFQNTVDILDRKYESGNYALNGYFSQKMFRDLIQVNPDKTLITSVLRVDEADKPVLYRSIKETDNNYLIDKSLIANTLSGVVKNDFNKIALYSSSLVFIALLLLYGRIELALISFIPMLITWIWILGIMGFAGIRFNLINIILSSLIFGLGDDFTIFTMDGLISEYRNRKKVLHSYRISILLAAITTLTGLGVLIFAKHPILNSVAVVSILGIVCVWFISQTLQPFLFRLLITNRTDKGYHPWTLVSLIRSVYAFVYFALGSLLVGLAGLPILKLRLFGKKSKYAFHYLLSKCTGSVIKMMFNVKKEMVNPQGETFEKPAVIISNHQSFIDILAITMLNPKLILLTNNWVWNSPVFGSVVRMAGYYPVTDGAEQSIQKLKAISDQGYSIAVFPEGTRSVDGSIKRFHKGAFFIADALQLDIIPILLHGTGQTITKGDFKVNSAAVNIKILPRISPGDKTFGEGYAEKTKSILKYFRKQYEAFSDQMETPKHFYYKLVNNYLYKGPILEWYLKVKVRMEHYYEPFDSLIPKSASVLDLGCGYGFLCYILAFRSKERVITGVDYDEDKISVARNCFERPASLNFVCEDVTKYDGGTYDVVIISDVLHYLSESEQEALLEKYMLKIKENNGKLIIRDGDKDLKERHKGTQRTEFYSTRFFKFNKTKHGELSYISGKKIADMAAGFGLDISSTDNTRHTSNIIFVIQNKLYGNK